MDNFKLIKNFKDELYGFDVFIYEHKVMKSGFVYVKTEEANNAFSIAFKTIPTDDCGSPHMFEHLTLSGSKKYPIPDIFFELCKRSCSYFLNAMTYPCFTIYPFGCTNEKDFHNILDVYLDAVFDPKLDYDQFLKECYSLQFKDNDPENSLEHTGVIYNEMSQSHGKASSIASLKLRKLMFPESSTQYLSGGVPKDITKATLDKLKELRDSFYHPSNSLCIFVGNIDPNEVMEKVQSYFSQYEYSEFPKPVLQKPFTERVRSTVDVPSSDNEKSYSIYFGFRIPDGWLRYTTIYEIMQHLLGGGIRSYLFKDLVETKLASEVSVDSNFYYVDKFFDIQVLGVKEELVDKVIDTVHSTLKRVTNEGYDREMIEDRFKSTLFTLNRNPINTEYAINYMTDVAYTWFLTDDYYDNIDELKNFDDSMKIYKENPNIFEELSRAVFLDNKHVVTLVCKPVDNYFDNEKKLEAEELSQRKEKLTPEEIKKIVDDYKYVEECDKQPKNIETLPKVSRYDLSFIDRYVHPKETFDDEVAWFASPYKRLVAVNIHARVDPDFAYNEYFPLYFNIIKKLGSEKYSPQELAGISEKYLHLNHFNISCETNLDGSITLNFSPIIYSLSEDYEMIFEYLEQVFFHPVFDKGMIENVSKGVFIKMFRSLSSKTFDFASSVAATHTEKGILDDVLNGFTGYKARLKLLEEKNYDKVAHILSEVSKQFFNSKVVACVSSRSEIKDAIVNRVKLFLEQWKQRRSPAKRAEVQNIPKFTVKNYVKVDTQTGSASVSFKAPSYKDSKASSFYVFNLLFKHFFYMKTLRSDFGCYGAVAKYDRFSSMATYSSYCDTDPKRTMESFIKILKECIDDATAENLDDVMVKVFGSANSPRNMLTNGFSEWTSGMSKEFVTNWQNSLLEVTLDDVKSQANYLLSATRHDCISTSESVCAIPNGFKVSTFKVEA